MKNSELIYGMKLTGMKGEVFEIADLPEYRKRKRVLVRFVETDNYQYVDLKSIPDVVDMGKPFLFGIGYISSTKEHPAREDGTNSTFIIWKNMIERCYSGSNKSYEDVSVCEVWHDFTMFKQWILKTKNSGKVGWCVDKDLLNENERIYSPDTCVLLPKEINFMLSNKKFLVDCDFSKNNPFKAYKLRLLLDKYEYDLQPNARNYLKKLIDKYESEYKNKKGFTISSKFSKKINVSKKKLCDVGCICMIKYDNELVYFDNLQKIKHWLKELEKNLNKEAFIQNAK